MTCNWSLLNSAGDNHNWFTHSSPTQDSSVEAADVSEENPQTRQHISFLWAVGLLDDPSTVHFNNIIVISHNNGIQHCVMQIFPIKKRVEH